MQITINSANIVTFGFSTTFDVANKSVIFDIAELTEFNGNGGTLIQGINFSINDSSGNPLILGNSGGGTWDWDAPNIEVPSTGLNPDYDGDSTFTLDLSTIWGDKWNVLFQTYRIQGAIKDENGTVYETGVLVQNVCQPKGLTDLGYIIGEIQIKADCPNGFLTVKELTNTSYNGESATTIESVGTFYYPRGTIDPIEYTFDNSVVNFTNNVVYTGNYKIVNTTTAQYVFDEDFIVQLEYYTSSEKFDVTCEKQMLAVMCCLTDFEIYMKRYCTGDQAAAMQAKWNEAGTYLAYGLVREAAGKDASAQVAKIKQLLNCNCGEKAVKQIAPDPVNPIIYSIVVDGQYGTSVTSETVGNTKTFDVSSNTYVVAKKVVDLAYTIDTITSVPGVVTYKLSFNYDVLAQTILNTIDDSSSLLQEFNGLIDLSNINGKCVLDMGASNYFLAQRIASSLAIWTNVVIGATTYNAPADLLVSDTAGAKAWLDGLGVGVYVVSYTTDDAGANYINVLSNNNTYQPINATFGSTTALFQKTTRSISALFQAAIDYLCAVSGAEIPIGVEGDDITVCSIDYNGEVVETVYPYTTTIAELLAVLASVNCDLIGYIETSVVGSAENGIVKTGGGVYRLGTNPLVVATQIDQAGFLFSIINGIYLYRGFEADGTTFYAREGSSAADLVSLFIQKEAATVLQITTNEDREDSSYYAKNHVEVNENNAILGSHYPTSNDINDPSPLPVVPELSAFIRTVEGALTLYGQAQIVQGDTFTFDGIIPVLPLLTTAERVALTPANGWKCFDTDFGAEMVYNSADAKWFGVRYNTGAAKFQGYNGASWSNLD